MDRSKFDEMMKMSEPEEAAPAPGMQFGFDVVEVQKVNLGPGDTLMVTVKNDELTQTSVDALRTQLQTVFPDNKVFVFAMGTSDDVQLSVVSQPPQVDSCSPVSYCSDCNCGKKEQAGG